MGFKFFAFLFLLVGVQSWASPCLLNEALKDPALSGNPQFWEEYGKLAAKTGKAPDDKLETLIVKFRGSLPSASSKTASTSSVEVRLNSKAEKEIHGLPKNLKGKVDEVIEILSSPTGMKTLYDNPGRWHLEKLAQFGDHAYSVRLNDGYRVLFNHEHDTTEIRRVNKGQIHGN